MGARNYLYEEYKQSELAAYYQSSLTQEFSRYECDKKAAREVGIEELTRVLIDILIRTQTHQELYCKQHGEAAYEALLGAACKTPLQQVTDDLAEASRLCGLFFDTQQPDSPLSPLMSGARFFTQESKHKKEACHPIPAPQNKI